MNTFIYILGLIIACQVKVKANYIIIGGDLHRCHSNSTIALNYLLCTEHDLAWVSSVYHIDFTHVSDIKGIYSSIDHFIIH